MMVLVNQIRHYHVVNTNQTSFSLLLQNGKAPSADHITHRQTQRFRRIVRVFLQVIDI